MPPEPFYKDPKIFDQRVDEYVAHCIAGEDYEFYDRKRKDVRTVKRRIPMNLARLALWLGFAHRQSLIDYSDKPAFSASVMRAKSLVEADMVEGAMSGEYDSKVTSLILSSSHGHSIKTATDSLAESISDILQQVHLAATRPALPAKPLEIDSED